MRLQNLILVLLAVIYHVSAGLIRYHERPVRVGHYVRSFNQSTVAADVSQRVESTPVTSSLSSSSTFTHSPSITVAPTTTLSKQVGSVPAEGDGPGAAKIDTASLDQLTLPAASSPSLAASSSQAKVTGLVAGQSSGLVGATFTPEGLTQTPFATKTTAALSGTGSIAPSPQQIQSTPESSGQSVAALTSSTASTTEPATTFTTRPSLGTGVATLASQTQSSQTQPATSSSGIVIQSVPSSVQAQSNATATAPSSLVPIPSKGSTTSSSSTTASSTQATGPSLSEIPVAKGGNAAIANAYNQQFRTLTPDSACSSKDRTQAHACINGLFAECNSAGRYTMTACSEGQQCFALPMPAGATGIFVQCDKPSDASQKLQSGSNTSNSSTVGSTTVSAASPSSSSSSSSSTTSGPATVVPTTPVFPTPQQSQGVGSSTQTTEPLTTQTSSQTSTIPSVTQPTPAGPSNVAQPNPASLVSKQSSTMAAASSTDVPLIISFPSSSSTVPQPSVPPSKPTRLQNPAPAPAAPTVVVSQELLTQPSPPQSPPTSTPTGASTSTSPTAPGITIVPLGNDGGNSKETVTVTVTTTERL